MKPIAWLTFGLLITICTSCSAFSYFGTHPQELQDVEQLGSDSVKLVEDVVEGK